MKQLFSILFFFMSLSFLTLSCSDDNDSDSNNNGDNSVLLGSWGEDMGGGEFFEFTFYSDNTGVMNVYKKNGGKDPDPFAYTFDKDNMRLTIIFDSDPEPPVVYDVKVSKGLLKLNCVSGDFDKFTLYKTKDEKI